jgi:autotransporter-associated beta strand protein
VPSKHFYQIAASAVALAVAAPAAQAVIFHSTGDPTFHTTAPTTGTFANSGFQYQVDLGPFSGTVVAPFYFVTAAHTGASLANNFDYNGVHYNTVQVVADFDDIRVMKVDKPFYSYAPLYDLAPTTEQNKQAVVMGRGTQRGTERKINGVSKGWDWGATDSVRRWGTNTINSFANNNTVMGFTFDLNADPNEAILSGGDSGAGLFIKVGQEWTLAGVNFTVSGPYTIPPDDVTEYLGAFYDTSGMKFKQTGLPAVGPSSAYATMISAHATEIKNLISLPPTWKNANGGAWTTAGNWTLPTGTVVPNAVGAIADFRTAIGAAQNVTFSGTITVGQIDFDNPSSYSLIPSNGSSQLHLNVASGNATVNVASGNHNISALHLDDPTTFHVIQPASTLTANISSAAGQAITKTGAGTLAVNRLVSGAVTVSQGTVKVNSGGTSATTSKVTGGVSVDTVANAKLDLTNNDMVVANTAVGAKVGANYTGLTGLIAQAYSFGDWTGPGISSANAGASGGLTTLGIASASQVFGISGAETAMWSGQTVGPNDTLIAYTYAGDANLDGVIDGGDYGIIDNFVQVPGASGYANGDFNYDGVIDGGDYGIIDNNVQAQGTPLISAAVVAAQTSAASSAGVSAVPEPAATSLVAFASVALLQRRRRRQRSANA